MCGTARLSYIQGASGTKAARDTLATGLLSHEFDPVEEERPDVRAFRDSNQPAMAQIEVALGHGLIAYGRVPLAGQRDAAHGSADEDSFQFIAMRAAARIPFDDVSQRAAKFDFQDAGLGKTVIQAKSFSSRRGFCAKSSVFRGPVFKDPGDIDE